jgi:hypothetical protein
LFEGFFYIRKIKLLWRGLYSRVKPVEQVPNSEYNPVEGFCMTDKERADTLKHVLNPAEVQRDPDS